MKLLIFEEYSFQSHNFILSFVFFFPVFIKKSLGLDLNLGLVELGQHNNQFLLWA